MIRSIEITLVNFSVTECRENPQAQAGHVGPTVFSEMLDEIKANLLRI